jgi:AAHS family 4-hydroxybenzoate transporter-like MFS transporter
MSDAAIELSSVMNRQKLSKFQIGMIALCALIVAVDGFDTQSIGFIGPALIAEFKVQRPALGPVFSAGLFGLFLGSFLISPVADRFGRKVAILVSVTIFGLFSIAAAQSSTLDELMIWRFLTGIGLGGGIPTALTMASDYAPEQRRGSMVMLVSLANPVGSSLGAFMSAELISLYGWRSVLWAGALLPLCLAMLLLFTLRESPRWLALQDGSSKALRDIVARIAPEIPNVQSTRFVVADTRESGVPVRKLFADGRAVGTVLLWIAFFMGILDLFLLAQWLPTLMSSAGASAREAVASTALFQIGGLVGGLALGHFVDKKGNFALATTFLGMAAFIILTGLVSSSIYAVFVTVFCAGFFLIASVTGVNGYAAAFYPTSARSTGIGWGLALGRMGSIVGPLIAGFLLALHWTNSSVFMACAIPAVLASIAMLLMPKRTAPVTTDTAQPAAVTAS